MSDAPYPGPLTCASEDYDYQQPTVLSIGLRHSERLTVERRHTVPEVETSWPDFKDIPPVLGTAMMATFIEQTCIMGLRPFFLSGQHTVGTRWTSTTSLLPPKGMTITAEVELIGIEGKALLFKVCCREEAGLISEGTHRRAIIDVARFMQRLQEKSKKHWSTLSPNPLTAFVFPSSCKR